MLVESLKMPTDENLFKGESHEKIFEELKNAEAASRRRNWKEVLGYSRRVMTLATNDYLHIFKEKVPLQTLYPITALIDALLFASQCMESWQLLREAESLAQRAFSTASRYKANQQDVASIFVPLFIKIAKFQNFIIHKGQASGPLPMPGFQLAMARVESMFEEIQQFERSNQFSLALGTCEMLVDDLLFVMACLKHVPDVIHPEMLRPTILSELKDLGAKTPEIQRELYRQWCTNYRNMWLASSLEHLSNLRFVTGDSDGAEEAEELLSKISSTPAPPANKYGNGQLKLPADRPLYEITMLVKRARELVKLGDAQSLDQAEKALTKADLILDQKGDRRREKAWICHVRATVLYAQKRFEEADQVINRGLRAARHTGNDADEIRRDLKSCKALVYFELGMLERAIRVAREVVSLPEGETVGWRIARAREHLNLAKIEFALRKKDAKRHLIEALSRIELNLSEEIIADIFMLGCQMYIESDVELAHKLNLAAAAALDAQRVLLQADQSRVAFDEATHRRVIYETLVNNYLSAGLIKEAVAAADRGRARALAVLLIDPESIKAPVINLSKHDPPALKQEDVRGSLMRGAEYVIRNADSVLRQSALEPVLHESEVAAFCKEIGVPTLIIQPVLEQVALIVLLPTGDVAVRYSPLSLAEILTQAEAAQKEYYIFSTYRGDSDKGTEAEQAEEDIQALRNLWVALIEPIEDLLNEGAALMLVPYRELSLVPFALLRDEAGRSLLERYAFCLIPSLTTLWTIKRRKAWSRKLPEKIYLVGDPSIKGGFNRLPHAREDVEEIGSILKSSGIPAEKITLRQDDEATEESYRREARKSDLLHLACHAKIKEPAYLSYLHLAPATPYNGELTASEIRNVLLNDALVFLAACQTGQGRVTADSVIGLGRAFLEAGARAVILSLWKVEDAATSVLTKRFYRALFDQAYPRNAVEAMRIAMLATRDDLRAGRIVSTAGKILPSHPNYWAPFVIIGDGLSVKYEEA
jgi:CHAT domain-containing protein